MSLVKIVSGYCPNCESEWRPEEHSFGIIDKVTKEFAYYRPNEFTPEQIKNFSPVRCGRCKTEGMLISVESVVRSENE